MIHSYESGWKGATMIPDPPVPDAIRFLREALEHFRVAIYSSRSGHPGGIEAMQTWLRRHTGNPDWLAAIEWPTEKPPALVTIDDRAIPFDGTWPAIETLLAFKPWNKR